MYDFAAPCRVLKIHFKTNLSGVYQPQPLLPHLGIVNITKSYFRDLGAFIQSAERQNIHIIFYHNIT